MNLSDKQKANWNTVLNYMEASDIRYCHARFESKFESIKTNHISVCACSFVFLSGFYGNEIIETSVTYPNGKYDKFHDVFIADFGDECFLEVFNGSSKFSEWMEEVTDLTSNSKFSPKRAAALLRKYLNVPKDLNLATDDAIIRVVYRTDQQHDFPSKEFAKQFFDLNPDWKAAIILVQEIKQVTRVIIEEVCTDIKLF